MQQFTIGANEAGQRFDKYLKKLLKDAPSSFLYKMLRKKNILLNGKKADGSEKLQIEDQVKLFLSDETIEKFSGQASGREPVSSNYPVTALDVIYEDPDILVINKPAGMLSQKAKPDDCSANEYIIGYLLEQGTLTEQDLKTFSPSVCNRLDRNTSGLLIAGKTLKGLQNMARQLQNRALQKYYRCLVIGNLTKEQTIEGWILKDEKTNRVRIMKKEIEGSGYIRTGYRPLFCYWDSSEAPYTLVEVHLITGKSHQIRAHLSSIGFPIVGDPKYGDKKTNEYFAKKYKIKGQLLHAYRLVFPDQTELVAPLPVSFENLLQKWKSQKEG